MTTTHPCGRSDLHEKYDGLRATSDALGDEIAAAIRPAQKAGRELSSSEKARVEAVRTAREANAVQLRSVHHELDDLHMARKCAAAPAATGSGSTPQAAELWEKSTNDTEFTRQLDAMLNRSSATAQGLSAGRDTRWSAKAFEQIGGPGGAVSARKALATPGSVMVPTAFDTRPLREGERPDSLRRLIPVTTLTGTDRFGYMRQVVRTSRAAPVAPGRLKPTSIYSVARVEDHTRTVAHLSEPVNRQDLADVADLGIFLDQEMRYGLLSAVEDQIVSGTGAPPTDDPEGEADIAGILATVGVIAQAWAGDLFTTTRRALTVQQQLANAPTAWAMSAADWEAIELTREDSATTGGFILGTSPIDRAAQRLWGLPVVVTDAVPTGRAILGDWAGSARIYQREEAQVEWSDAMYYAPAGTEAGSSLFARNQMIMRCEERVGFAITRPSAFADVDLTAA